MSAIDDLFAKLRSENRKAFMPFVTAGDPDLGRDVRDPAPGGVIVLATSSEDGGNRHEEEQQGVERPSSTRKEEVLHACDHEPG